VESVACIFCLYGSLSKRRGRNRDQGQYITSYRITADIHVVGTALGALNDMGEHDATSAKRYLCRTNNVPKQASLTAL